jgi:hypothetical protein
MNADDDLVQPPSLWPRLVAVVVVIALAGSLILRLIDFLAQALFAAALVTLLAYGLWHLIGGSRSKRSSR